MTGYEVTIKGTWARPNTAPEDITMMRRLSSRLRQEGLNARLSGRERPPIQFWLTARQRVVALPGDPFPMREGTFKVVVFVKDTSWWIKTTRVRAGSRAKVMLKWLLQDTTCRPPTFAVDSVEVRRV